MERIQFPRFRSYDTYGVSCTYCIDASCAAPEAFNWVCCTDGLYKIWSDGKIDVVRCPVATLLVYAIACRRLLLFKADLQSLLFFVGNRYANL
jgi:hypothetical protein